MNSDHCISYKLTLETLNIMNLHHHFMLNIFFYDNNVINGIHLHEIKSGTNERIKNR